MVNLKIKTYTRLKNTLNHSGRCYYGGHFISRYGCKEHFAHNNELLFYERQKEIIMALEELAL